MERLYFEGTRHLKEEEVEELNILFLTTGVNIIFRGRGKQARNKVTLQKGHGNMCEGRRKMRDKNGGCVVR